MLLGNVKSYGFDAEALPESILHAVENRQTITPIVRFDPMYPLKASKKWAFAKPINIQINKCAPSDVFEDASKQALSRWMFQKVERLNKQESTDDLLTTITFELR